MGSSQAHHERGTNFIGAVKEGPRTRWVDEPLPCIRGQKECIFPQIQVKVSMIQLPKAMELFKYSTNQEFFSSKTVIKKWDEVNLFFGHFHISAFPPGTNILENWKQAGGVKTTKYFFHSLYFTFVPKSFLTVGSFSAKTNNELLS